MDREHNLVVTIDLPEINKEDIEINIKEDMLEISAKTGKEKETEEEGYIRKEKIYLLFPNCPPAHQR